jgi:RNA polymerase sigma factor (sigma-70 family)
MSSTPETRASLLLRLKDPGDERAWTEFLEIYQPVIYRLIRRRGFQDADAGELTQEVLVAVAGAIDRFDPARDQGTFRGWLYRITRNLMINLLDQRKRRPQPAGGSDMLRLLEQQSAPDPDRSALFDAEYRGELFRWAAERIRGEFRESTWQAFWLSCVKGQAIRDVAAQLQLSPGAVYVARSRVMARLKQKVQESLAHQE